MTADTKRSLKMDSHLEAMIKVNLLYIYIYSFLESQEAPQGPLEVFEIPLWDLLPYIYLFPLIYLHQVVQRSRICTCAKYSCTSIDYSVQSFIYYVTKVRLKLYNFERRS